MHEEDSKRKGKARASDEKSPIVKRSIEDPVSIKTTMPLLLWATPYYSLHCEALAIPCTEKKKKKKCPQC
jgi:hypothetical protein